MDFGRLPIWRLLGHWSVKLPLDKLKIWWRFRLSFRLRYNVVFHKKAFHFSSSRPAEWTCFFFVFFLVSYYKKLQFWYFPRLEQSNSDEICCTGKWQASHTFRPEWEQHAKLKINFWIILNCLKLIISFEHY